MNWEFAGPTLPISKRPRVRYNRTVRIITRAGIKTYILASDRISRRGNEGSNRRLIWNTSRPVQRVRRITVASCGTKWDLEFRHDMACRAVGGRAKTSPALHTLDRGNAVGLKARFRALGHSVLDEK